MASKCSCGWELRTCHHPGCKSEGCSDCLDQCSYCDEYFCSEHRVERLDMSALRKRYHICSACVAVTEKEYELAESLLEELAA